MKTNIILFLLLIFNTSLAQDYSAMYRLDLNDASSYSFSCGSAVNNEWTVSRNSCNLYTPVLTAGELQLYQLRDIDVNIRLTTSGNLEDNDFAWIFYYIDEKPAGSKTIKGSDYGAEVTFKDVIKVPARSKYHIRVALVCDDDDEFWKLSSGDLFIGQKLAEGEEVIEDPQATNKVYAKKDRGIVRLHWNDKFNGDEQYYQIERSADGVQFQFAGFVKRNNAAGETIRNTFIDSAPFQPASFYRVTKIQAQGKQENFGEVVKVRW